MGPTCGVYDVFQFQPNLYARFAAKMSAFCSYCDHSFAAKHLLRNNCGPCSRKTCLFNLMEEHTKVSRDSGEMSPACRVCGVFYSQPNLHARFAAKMGAFTSDCNHSINADHLFRKNCSFCSRRTYLY